jgi:F0F1-type ATP synthase membrane subunit b/b'
MSVKSDRDRDQDCASDDNLDLTAHALDQLDEAERAEIERQLAEANGDASRLVQQTRRLAEKVREALAADNPPASADLRETLVQRMTTR